MLFHIVTKVAIGISRLTKIMAVPDWTLRFVRGNIDDMGEFFPLPLHGHLEAA